MQKSGIIEVIRGLRPSLSRLVDGWGRLIRPALREERHVVQ
jgi:hypothetical protein